MDRPTLQPPILHPILRQVAETDRLRERAQALPTRARVSEPALPLVVAALYEELGRGLVALAAEDADARDLAEAAGWYLGADRVGFLPGRGVRWESGLTPPPHLVGERARALDVLAGGGLVVVSAPALIEGMPPPGTRPSALGLEVGDEPGIDSVAEHLALAGYERADRVEERGQF